MFPGGSKGNIEKKRIRVGLVFQQQLFPKLVAKYFFCKNLLILSVQHRLLRWPLHCVVYSISYHWSFAVPFESIRKPEIFLFSGNIKKTSGIKQV